MKFEHKLKKYLVKNESRWKLNHEPKNLFEKIIVIPAIAELNNIETLLDALSGCGSQLESTLIIIVVNNSNDASKEIKENNFQTISLLEELIEKRKYADLNLTFIDCATDGNDFSAKEAGVGMARKTGMDLALNYFQLDEPGKNILISLDADCTVAENYLDEITKVFNNESISAAIIDFEHHSVKDSQEETAIICYEIFLSYYTAGLRFAKSPFAFHAIGSCIAGRPESYINAGGMNKRKAGEDFYFLQKIAKNGKIKPVYSTKVFPSSRKSHRVPFGTGQRVDRFLKKTHDEYLLYDPEIFNLLKKWNSFFLNPINNKTDDFKNTANSLGSSFKDYLQKINFFDAWNKVLHSSASKEQVQKQKLFVFDGFKTLKLIHHLRDTTFPIINMFEALDTFFKLADIKSEIDRTENIPDLEDQLEYNFLLKNYLKREPINYL